jgi:hypothetical protein
MRRGVSVLLATAALTGCSAIKSDVDLNGFGGADAIGNSWSFSSSAFARKTEELDTDGDEAPDLALDTITVLLHPIELDAQDVEICDKLAAEPALDLEDGGFAFIDLFVAHDIGVDPFARGGVFVADGDTTFVDTTIEVFEGGRRSIDVFGASEGNVFTIDSLDGETLSGSIDIALVLQVAFDENGGDPTPSPIDGSLTARFKNIARCDALENF